ncbi:hypothetical protein BGZ83_011703 [Gryganskiella cystojenkinii]|nr:hypothetical protein BGZ83_011703 [Gryganskiella cystojenkinii]
MNERVAGTVEPDTTTTDLAVIQQQQEEDAAKIRATRDYWRGRLSNMMPLAHVTTFYLSQENHHSLQSSILARILGCLPPTIISLDLRALNDWSDQDTILDMTPFGPWDHPSLRTLRLVLGGNPQNNKTILNWFLRRCPVLFEFSYKSHSAPAVELLPGLDLSLCPLLEILHLKAEMESDQFVSMVHSARRLSEFSIAGSGDGFTSSGQDVWRALKPHAATLRSIRLQGVPISSPDMQSILQSWSKLEHFAVIEGTNNDLRACLDLQDMFKSDWAWSCLGLKSLELHFAHEIEPIKSSQDHAIFTNEALEMLWTRYPQTHPDVLRVYLQLSLLTELEFLQVFMIHPSTAITTAAAIEPNKDESEGRSLLGLDYSIESGLEILSPLKKLRKLGIYTDTKLNHLTRCCKTRIGQAEVEWMLKNWPKLSAIEVGNNNASTSGLGEAAGPLSWLQEQRPGLEIVCAPRPS